MGCAFRYDREELKKLEQAVRVCLPIFSLALDVCRIAKGRIDGAVYGLSQVYDHAAPALIAQESGVKVTNFGKDTWNVFGIGMVAAKPETHAALSGLFYGPLENLDEEETVHINHDLEQ